MTSHRIASSSPNNRVLSFNDYPLLLGSPSLPDIFFHTNNLCGQLGHGIFVIPAIFSQALQRTFSPWCAKGLEVLVHHILPRTFRAPDRN